MEPYLNTSKSVIISSPAGSGKTEKLSRRYISLLDPERPSVEKIVCITFTEKAAAEMKERIKNILERDFPELYRKVLPQIPLMRITTIHAFCLKILKRFSMELGLDPALAVMDEQAAKSLWNEAVYDCIIEEREKPSGFFELIQARGFKGFGAIKRYLDVLHSKSPMPELYITQTGLSPDEVPTEGDTLEIMRLYALCLARYKSAKEERGFLDFNDLELMALKALSMGEISHDILYSFDEHTDHLLVDEFQDTSSLQWDIIDKLTEEWRAGLGSKRDSGVTPTIFLVGDEKQSIYLFRGANVGVFKEARSRFSEWLGQEYEYIEVTDNYRSLPAITEFANHLFERIMPPSLIESFMTTYSPFYAHREGQGSVRLLLLGSTGPTRLNRIKEAGHLARYISHLAASYEVYDKNVKRPCRYSDMAILLRKRTHLAIYEDALRQAGVPFIVVKGVGFFEEPEVAALRELVSFLTAPSDDHALFCVLRSMLFNIDYKTLARLARSRTSIWEKLEKASTKALVQVHARLEGFVERAGQMPLSIVLEEALVECGAWAYLSETSRRANVKKFISMIEAYEDEGLSPLEIREKLLRLRDAAEVPKANVNAEGMDAVSIMTIHAAKGLQFPMVFLPSLDEKLTAKSTPLVMDDSSGRIMMAIEEDSKKRESIEIFRRQKKKEEEEEKRLFYVAVTRAMDFLCMSGVYDEGKITGRLAFLDDAFNIFSTTPTHMEIFAESDIEALGQREPVRLVSPAHTMFRMRFDAPVAYSPGPRWVNVTEETASTGRHGQSSVAKGNVVHSLLEELSLGLISTDNAPQRAHLLAARHGASADVVRLALEELERLLGDPSIRSIVLPRENAFTELPFVLDRGETVYKGRMDRVILTPDSVDVYDYKTFSPSDAEMKKTLAAYATQMELYKEAAERLFNRKGRAFLIFTPTARIIQA